MNSPSFAGKTAIVTAATGGIGLAIARRLVDAGAKVAIAGRNIVRLNQLAAEYGEAVLAVRTDVTVELDIVNLINTVEAWSGQIDAVFNVAGSARLAPIIDCSSDDWDAVMALNLRSAFLSIKYAARRMMKTGGGSIVNISSLNAVVPFYGAANYATSKAGLGMLTQNAALELAQYSIRVNALLPGLTETPGTAPLIGEPAIRDAYMEKIPFKRAANADEIAQPALFLASEQASYITGATLIADGGWALTGYPDLRPFLFPG